MSCVVDAAATGFLVGAAAAIALDSAVYAHDTVENPGTISPVVQIEHSGTWVGIRGAF